METLLARCQDVKTADLKVLNTAAKPVRGRPALVGVHRITAEGIVQVDICPVVVVVRMKMVDICWGVVAVLPHMEVATPHHQSVQPRQGMVG